MTTPARVKQADMARAVRTAKKYGAARVTMGPDGSIVFDIQPQDDHPSADSPRRPPDDPAPIKMRKRAKEPMEF
jgi:hypothetical protein